MKKVYLKENVYEAAQERMRYIFNEFEKVLISFSGGMPVPDKGSRILFFCQHLSICSRHRHYGWFGFSSVLIPVFRVIIHAYSHTFLSR